MKKVRLLICGPGLIGKTHAELVARQPSCTLVSIVAPDTDKNRQVASKFGSAFHSELDAALDSENIDGVIISSPNAFHFKQAMACIDRRIPVLVEKPITDNLVEAELLTEASERTGVPVLVGHHRTYSRLLDAALKFLRSDLFGELVAMNGSALFFKPDHYFEAGPWRAVKGGGPILINLIHEIGLMRLIGGEISSVYAISGNSARQFEVEDTVSLSFKFINGALGTFMLSDAAASSKSWEMTSGENPAYPNYSDELCYHFAGSNGSLDFPTMRSRFYSASETRSWWQKFNITTIEVERSDPLEVQIEHFIEVIRKNATPRVSARDGFLNMLVIDAIMKSIETGQPVDVFAGREHLL